MSVIRETIVGPCRLLLGDCEKIGFSTGDFDAIVTDPPYGMNNNADYGRFSGGKNAHARRADGTGGKKHRKIAGDDSPPNLSVFTEFPQAIIWGLNFLNLPPGGALVWVKRKPEAFGTFLSDAELAWVKGSKGVFCFTSYPQAMARCRVHPNQKPVDLMEWCIQKLKRDASRILDPYMGSGTTGVACIRLGKEFTGIEISEHHYETAIRRCQEELKRKSQELFPCQQK